MPIHVNPEWVNSDGSIGVWLPYPPAIGTTINVQWDDRIGEALVAKTTMLTRGNSQFTILDVNWGSFDRGE